MRNAFQECVTASEDHELSPVGGRNPGKYGACSRAKWTLNRCLLTSRNLRREVLEVDFIGLTISCCLLIQGVPHKQGLGIPKRIFVMYP